MGQLFSRPKRTVGAALTAGLGLLSVVGMSAGIATTAGPDMAYAAGQSGAQPAQLGGWVPVPLPQVNGQSNESLSSVSCTSKTFCMAVGTYGIPTPSSGPAYSSFALEWNGSTWSSMGMDSTVQQFDPTSVSCASSRSCVAVGDAGPAHPPAPAAEHFDGSSWKAMVEPGSAPSAGVLNGVSCSGADFCAAVGFQMPSGQQLPYVQTWDGSTWSPVNVGGAANGETLSAVSCASTSWCEVIGSESETNMIYGSLAGGSLAITASQQTGYSMSALDCTSTTSCLAVGSTTKATTPPSSAYYLESAAMSFDGTQWSATSPVEPMQQSLLSSVSCVGVADCLSAGYQTQQAPGYSTLPALPVLPLVEENIGTNWSVVPDSTGSVAGSALNGISCAGDFCAAVGAFAETTSGVSAPVVTSVTPPSGSPSGGTTVDIQGSGFQGATAVGFGTLPAESFKVLSDSEIEAVSPAWPYMPGVIGNPPSIVDVTVATPGGVSATSSADLFDLDGNTSPVSTVESVSPSVGSVTGGNIVEIQTKNLPSAATGVDFGSVPAPFMNGSNGLVYAMVPQGAVGQVPVTVLYGSGSQGTASGAGAVYSYKAGFPDVVSIESFQGVFQGLVVLHGSGFTGASSVKFGSAQARFVVLNDSEILAIAPSGTGTVQVSVTNSIGSSGETFGDLYTS